MPRNENVHFMIPSFFLKKKIQLRLLLMLFELFGRDLFKLYFSWCVRSDWQLRVHYLHHIFSVGRFQFQFPIPRRNLLDLRDSRSDLAGIGRKITIRFAAPTIILNLNSKSTCAAAYGKFEDEFFVLITVLSEINTK